MNLNKAAQDIEASEIWREENNCFSISTQPYCSENLKELVLVQ